MSQSNTERSATTYQTQFDEIFAQLKANPAQLEEFLKNPEPILHAAGIPVLNTLPTVTDASSTLMTNAQAAFFANYKIDFEGHWWGVDVVMNEALTQAIATGAIIGPPLAALIVGALGPSAFITGPSAPVVAAAFSLVIAAKIVEIKLIDDGKGVHWPISWPQWATLVGAVPGGIAAVVIAMIAFIHPLRN